MRAQHRFLALAAAALLLLAVVAADEPVSSPDPTSPAGSLTPEPVANSEPLVAGRSEASGESESAGPVEQATTGGAPVSFAQAQRSHTEEMNGELLHSDATNLGSFSLDPLPGDAQSGPATGELSHSQESQESMDHDVDSEESLTSPACDEGCCPPFPAFLKRPRCPGQPQRPACSCAL